nr:polyprotein 1 [pineapple secovirus B]
MASQVESGCLCYVVSEEEAALVLEADFLISYFEALEQSEIVYVPVSTNDDERESERNSMDNEICQTVKDIIAILPTDHPVVNDAHLDKCLQSSTGKDLREGLDKYFYPHFDVSDSSYKPQGILGSFAQGAFFEIGSRTIGRLMTKMSAAVGPFAQLLAKMDLILDKVVSAFDWLANIVDGCMNFLTSLKDKFKFLIQSCLDKLKHFAEHFSYLMPLVCGVFFSSCFFFLLNKFLSYVAPSYVMSYSRLVEIISIVAAVIGIKEFGQYFMTMESDARKSFINAIKNFLGFGDVESGLAVNETEPQVQSGLMDVGLFGCLVSMITFFADEKFRVDFWGFAKTAAAIKNISDGYDKVSKMMGDITLWFFQRLGTSGVDGSGAAQALMLQTGIGLGQWMEDCEKLVIEGNTVTHPMQWVFAESRRLIDQGAIISSYFARSNDGTTFHLKARFVAVEKSLKEFYAKIKQANLSNQHRLTPFTICFMSAPGVGKSTAVRPFCDTFLDAMGEPKADRIYTRNGGDAYWSNYIRQPCVLFDDFGQTRQENNRFDEETLIQLVTCNPHMLPMAAVEEKGRPFDSKYIIMCTNREYAHAEADLADQNAFLRRRKLLWKVERDDRVAFDPTCCWKNLLFTRMDSLHPRLRHPDQVRLTFPDMIAYSANQARAHFALEQTMLDSISTCTDSFHLEEDQNGHFRVVFDNVDAEAHNVDMRRANNPNIERYRVQSGESFTYFSCQRPISQGLNCPNFSNHVDEFNTCSLDTIGGRVFFSGGGVFPEEAVQWSSDEIYFINTMAGATGMFEVQVNLLASLLMDDSNMEEFMDWKRNVLFDDIVGDGIEPSAIVQSRNPDLPNISFQEYWNKLSDRSRFLAIRWRDMAPKSTLRQAINNFKEAISEIKCVRLWESLPFWLKWAIGFFGIFAGGCAVYSSLRWLATLSQQTGVKLLSYVLGSDPFSVQGTSSGGDERVNRTRRVSVRGFRAQSAAYESIPHPDAWEKCKKAMIRIEGTGLKSHRPYAFCGVMIGPRKFVAPAHSVVLMNFGVSMMITNGEGMGCTFYCRYAPTMLDEYPEFPGKMKSLVVMEYSRLTPPLAYYSNVVVDFSQEVSRCTPGFIMPNINPDSADFPHVTEFYKVNRVDDIADAASGMTWKAIKTFHAKEAGKDGMCGRLALIDRNNTLQIVGMHCYGRPADSIFCDFEKHFVAEEYKVQSEYNQCFERTQITEMVDLVGTLDVRVPRLEKSQIEKSLIHDTLRDTWRDPLTEPTILSRTDPRPPYSYDPYDMGVRKFDKEAGPFDLSEGKEFDKALTDIRQSWLDLKPGAFKIDPVCSLDVAINGVDGIPYAENFPISTSEGYPYLLGRQHGETGKYRFFEEDLTGKRKPKGDWIRDLDEIEELCASEELEIFSVACAKDEKTKLAKVYETPKTRIFEILPFTYNLLVRKYFLFWMQWLMENHMNLPCKVGLDCFSYNWDIMASQHMAFANHFNGDYSGFDTNTSRTMMMKICDIVCDLADDGIRNRTIRRNLIWSAINRKLIIGDKIYEVRGGTPSGFALTVMINSVMNEWFLRASWYAIMRTQEPILANSRDFRSHVRLSVYGDDNVVSMSNQVVELYNLVTIAEYLKQFGIKLSDGAKTGVLRKRMNFEDIDFLKRKWVVGNFGWFHCPLDRTSIEEQLFWVKKSDDPLASIQMNVDNVLRESFHHGRDYFDGIRRVISKTANIKGIELLLLSFEDCADMWSTQRTKGNDAVPVCFDLPYLKKRYLETQVRGLGERRFDPIYGMTIAKLNNFDPKWRQAEKVVILSDGGGSYVKRNGALCLDITTDGDMQMRRLREYMTSGDFRRCYVTHPSNTAACGVYSLLAYLFLFPEEKSMLHAWVDLLDENAYKQFIKLNSFV